MPVSVLPPTTAGIAPEQFSDDLFFAGHRKVAAVVLAVFLVIGFALRVNDLGAESLGEDELNKLQTVEEYRSNGLTGKNGEHPFLMKGLQTVSIVGAEKINSFIADPVNRISDEAALRFPLVLAGTFTILLIFLLAAELFGPSTGLVAAVFWAVEPMAIGFDRIAKEDSLVLFFFLLTHLFWVRGQTAAEKGKDNWTWYAWAAAAAFAALMASKYYPHLLGLVGAYYIIFRTVPGRRWDMKSVRWIKFFIVMGVTFVVLNPTILLPDTWREMLKFSSEHRIGHDSYEFMGHLYRNQMTAWLSGVPWTFYFVFVGVKTSLVTLALFLIGLPVMFRRRRGDGRFFIFFWAVFWLISYTFTGGKFTRYFTVAEPLVLIIAAAGFCFLANWLVAKLPKGSTVARLSPLLLLFAAAAVTLGNSFAASPHFRMFTNTIGGGMAAAGHFFPHDEFYDAGTREIVAGLAARTASPAVVACETPALFERYAHKIGRGDLTFVSLSDRSLVAGLRTGDFVVLAEGRRYFSNVAYEEYLKGAASPAFEVNVVNTAARVYRLDDTMSAGIRAIAK